jgi:hypothetical protein
MPVASVGNINLGMKVQARHIRLFEDKEVYVIDEDSPLYGCKLIVDFFLADGTPLFRESETGAVIELRLDQISEEPPAVANNNTVIRT